MSGVYEGNRMYTGELLDDMKDWRRKESEAGRPNSLHDFYIAHDLPCRMCTRKGYPCNKRQRLPALRGFLRRVFAKIRLGLTEVEAWLD